MAERHGGDLLEATRRFGLPPGGWLDLSTGINPDPWPAGPLPPAALSRLPQQDDRLEAAARRYYRAPAVLAVPGSQSAIQWLPSLRPPSRVAVLGPTYGEHARNWRLWGHEVVELGVDALEAQLERWAVVVVVNPDNPTGRRLVPSRLLAWREALAGRGGWLVVDEAFTDVAPELSLAPHSAAPGLIVLRSLGKFFGLAGLRVGFVCAETDLLARLAERIGPWAVNGPARWWGTQALEDRAWQDRCRAALASAARRLDAALAVHGLTPAGGCSLFRWLPGEGAVRWQEALAQTGVWSRVYPRPLGLRLGLPPEADWERLERALAQAARWLQPGSD